MLLHVFPGAMHMFIRSPALERTQKIIQTWASWYWLLVVCVCVVGARFPHSHRWCYCQGVGDKASQIGVWQLKYAAVCVPRAPVAVLML